MKKISELHNYKKIYEADEPKTTDVKLNPSIAEFTNNVISFYSKKDEIVAEIKNLVATDESKIENISNIINDKKIDITKPVIFNVIRTAKKSNIFGILKGEFEEFGKKYYYLIVDKIEGEKIDILNDENDKVVGSVVKNSIIKIPNNFQLGDETQKEVDTYYIAKIEGDKYITTKNKIETTILDIKNIQSQQQQQQSQSINQKYVGDNKKLMLNIAKNGITFDVKIFIKNTFLCIEILNTDSNVKNRDELVKVKLNINNIILLDNNEPIKFNMLNTYIIVKNLAEIDKIEKNDKTTQSTQQLFIIKIQ